MRIPTTQMLQEVMSVARTRPQGRDLDVHSLLDDLVVDKNFHVVKSGVDLSNIEVDTRSTSRGARIYAHLLGSSQKPAVRTVCLSW